MALAVKSWIRRALLAPMAFASSAAPAFADINVTIAATPVPVVIGSLITYDIVIRNLGPDVAQNVGLWYGDFGFVSVTSEAPPGWQSGGVCITAFCSFQITTTQMPVGATATWRVAQLARPSPLDPESVSFAVGLVSAPADPTPTPEVVITTPIAGTGSADLQLELLSATPSVVPGGLATYRLRLINHGPSPARNVVVSAGVAQPNFPTPPPASVASMQGPSGWQCGDLPLPPRSVFCTLAEFPPGSADFTATAETSNSIEPPFEFNADSSSATPDPVPDNNEVSVVTPLGSGAAA